MTKKHYIEIANILKHERTFGEHQATVDSIAKELCSVFKRENSLFKKDVFLKACGVEE
jgi:uncharacterized protein YqgQ